LGTPYHSQVDNLHHGASSNLEALTREVAEKCIRCAACGKDCAFLRRCGTPGELAASYDPADKVFQSLPFECSLCQLCTAVCPVKLNPSDLFLEMRREKRRRDPLDYAEHAGLLAYEKRGTSQRFTYYAIPAHCDTVFFPGCALAGTRSGTTLKIYDHLKNYIPSLGIVLDCCLKISHDLGREDHFRTMFREMKDYLVQSGVKKIIVACPNCHRIFSAYGEELAVSTVYEIMDEHPLPVKEKVPGTVTVHDPCPMRFSPAVHASVRSLVAKQGLTIEEMPHHGESTVCCGEGGFVTGLSTDLVAKWKEVRKDEAAGRRMTTYCAGCTNHLDGISPTSHIVDLLWEPNATIAGKVGITKAPFTYLSRLKLKRTLKQRITAPITRERTFTGGVGDKRQGMMKRILLLTVVVALILSFRLMGATRYLDQETLRMLAIILEGALIGFTLGLILAVLAGSWVWLEMRVNVGLLIPAATFLCPVSTFWMRKAFSYSLFLMVQVFLLIVLIGIYGVDAGALCAVPAYLFREGFHGTGLTLATAGLMVGGIFLGGNLLWIAFSRERLFPTDDRYW